MASFVKFLFFCDRVSLSVCVASPSWPVTRLASNADLPASASWALRLKVCATLPGCVASFDYLCVKCEKTKPN